MRVDQKVLFVNYALVRSGRRKDITLNATIPGQDRIYPNTKCAELFLLGITWGITWSYEELNLLVF